ncbi:MAG: hypothetical protein JHC61_08250 [Burkholderiaceae bacterium]|nr:hypothetical protein [Burkholderiaceae bacterium]
MSGDQLQAASVWSRVTGHIFAAGSQVVFQQDSKATVGWLARVHISKTVRLNTTVF